MHLQFQSPFDDAAYRKAKRKGEGANHNKTASKTKPNHSRRRAVNLTTSSSYTVGMDIGEEFPPIETLLESPPEFYDLTAEQEPLAGQPESICLPEDARSNAVSACLESGGTEAPEVSLCSSASSQHARKHEPSNAPSSCGQAPSSQLTVSDGGGHPESLGVRGETLSGGDDDVPPGEWEAAEIIGEEVQDGVQHYVVVWKPTLEPEDNLGHLKELIEEWKAKVRALGEKERSGSGINKPGTDGKSRIKKGRAGSGGAKRGRGSRPRKL